MLKKSNPEHRIVVEYDKAMAEYDAYWESIRQEGLKNRQPENVELKLKKLVEPDYRSLYILFKQYYRVITGDVFDNNANEGEVKILAYTMLYYFFRDERFLNSPLINNEITDPHLGKGVLIIGGYGCGKTSVLKAIRQMFFEAERNPDIVIFDCEGDEVSLRRYRRLFGFFTANEVVERYEMCGTGEEKEKFWQIFNKGEIAFDDVMTEHVASNYGKIELFKDIIEKRYDAMQQPKSTIRTHVTCNYEGNVNETLTSIGRRYGARVYDRLFHMFTVIELKGKSLRK